MTQTPDGDGYVRDRVRPVRVSDELWDAAKAKAKTNDETVAQVIRRALREYTTTTSRTGKS